MRNQQFTMFWCLLNAIVYLHIGNFEVYIIIHMYIWLMFSTLVSSVSSLSLKDFDVPEFANFGRRVVLKVSFFPLTNWPWPPIETNDWSFSCLYPVISHPLLAFSHQIVDSNINPGTKRTRGIFSLVKIENWTIYICIHTWEFSEKKLLPATFSESQHLNNKQFQCEHKIDYNDGKLESVKWYKVEYHLFQIHK